MYSLQENKSEHGRNKYYGDKNVYDTEEVKGDFYVLEGFDGMTFESMALDDSLSDYDEGQVEFFERNIAPLLPD